MARSEEDTGPDTRREVHGGYVPPVLADDNRFVVADTVSLNLNLGLYVTQLDRAIECGDPVESYMLVEGVRNNLDTLRRVLCRK